jgi:uncharacterized protein (TIGR02996 family)
MTNEDFLRRIEQQPADDTARLVYADWLEERSEPLASVQAEFLRLTVELGRSNGFKPDNPTLLERLQEFKRRKGRPVELPTAKEVRARLRDLASQLEENWLSVVSRLPIENCETSLEPVASRAEARAFKFLCPQRWEDLEPTDTRMERFCDACQQNVHYCHTIEQARTHALQGACVAINLAVLRKPGDLLSPGMLMGAIDPSYFGDQE